MSTALRRSALAQSRLIRDLLDLSRLRSGKLTLNKETVSVVEAVNNAVETDHGAAIENTSRSIFRLQKNRSLSKRIRCASNKSPGTF
jgi:signal transduction histidine kinase